MRRHGHFAAQIGAAVRSPCDLRRAPATFRFRVILAEQRHVQQAPDVRRARTRGASLPFARSTSCRTRPCEDLRRHRNCRHSMPISALFTDRFRHCRQAWALSAIAGALACGDGETSSPAVGAAGAAGVAAGSGGTASDPGGPAGSGGTPAGAAGESGEMEEPMARLARYHGVTRDRSLRFEMDAVEGLAPFASSLDYLQTFVARAVDKPDGISFEADETLDSLGEDHAWSFDELDAFARLHTTDDSEGPVTIHVLFVDGRYDSAEDSGTVLGLAWGQRHIALFQDAIRAGCSSGLIAGVSSTACEVAERNVWAHEIGHVLGVVDNGLLQQSPHRDAAHGRHDQSDTCLMYWAYERPQLFDLLLSRLANGQSGDIDFCPNCWADLHAAAE
jgi:hypothetical protein